VADVQPFRGLRYNLEQIGDLSLVISPPFDVISSEEQILYHLRSPYNVIRLEFGEERPEDSPRDNKYTRAAQTMESWLRQAILVREEHPAFYLVEHRFRHQNSLRSRFGLIARVRLEDLSTGQIRLHERTMREPALDRRRLLQSCRANFNPIMAMFQHEGEGIGSLFREVTPKSPTLSAVDDYGVAHYIWVVTDEKTIARVSDFFADKILYIADGHHRYETALAYHRDQRSAHSSYSGKEAFNFVMMVLMDSEDPNLVMFTPHRLVQGLEAGRLEGLEKGLGSYFHKELVPPLATQSETLESWLHALKREGYRGAIFGLYGLHGQHLCLLEAREKEALVERMPADWPRPLKDLDVSLLHWLILRQMLGIDSAEKEDSCLEYTRDGLEALSWVDSGAFQLAFLLNPVPISSVLAAADTGVRLPPKSTYFYPKTPTGLVINPLWDD